MKMIIFKKITIINVILLLIFNYINSERTINVYWKPGSSRNLPQSQLSTNLKDNVHIKSIVSNYSSKNSSLNSYYSQPKLPNIPKITTRIPKTYRPSIFPNIYKNSANIASIAKSNNNFAFKLYRSLIKTHKNNVFISPISLFNLLIVVFTGSSSNTAHEMGELLQINEMNERNLQIGLRQILHTLARDIGKKNVVKVLNAMLIDRNYNISYNYTEKIRVYFNVYLEKVGFSTEPDHVLNWTNELVNWWTEGFIPVLLKEKPDPLTKILLINAVYFKAQWKILFDPKNTVERNFHNSDGSQSKVLMMNSESIYEHYCDHVTLKFCAIDIPYATKSLSLLIILPDNKKSMQDIEHLLSYETLNSIISSLKPKTIKLTMPKLELNGDYDLLIPLEDMGMKAIFSSELADLSKMSQSKELYIKDAIHRARIVIDEEGTVASATSAVEIGSRKRPPKFLVNRPFIFIILSHELNLVLFLGKVAKLP